MIPFLLLFFIFVCIHGNDDVSISIQPDNYFDPSQGNYHDSIQNRSCWDRLYSVNSNICKSQDIESKMKFAWDLMNCLLEDTGHKVFICKSKHIKLCTSKLPESTLQIFTQQLSNIDAKCFYIDSSFWRSEHSSANDSIMKNNEQLISQMKDTKAMQYVLQDQNDQILNEQHHLSNSLNRFFTETQIKMDLFYNEIMKSMNQTRSDIKDSMETFHSMLHCLHSAVLHLFGTTTFWIQTVLYCIVIFIITSIPGFSIARGPLFCSLVVSILVRFSLHWMLDSIFSKEIVQGIEMAANMVIVAICCFNVISRIWNKRKNEKEQEIMLKKIYEATVDHPILNQGITSRICHNK